MRIFRKGQIRTSQFEPKNDILGISPRGHCCRRIEPHSLVLEGASDWPFVGRLPVIWRPRSAVGGAVAAVLGLDFYADSHVCRPQSDENFGSNESEDKNGRSEALAMTFHRTLRSRGPPKSSGWVATNGLTSEAACMTRRKARS